MPRGGARSGAGRPKKGQEKGSSLKEELAEIKNTLPAIIPPKPIIDGDERDAAAQTNDVLQYAGQMMRGFQALIGKENAPPTIIDDYMKWMNVVLRTAAMLLPYQRPTYRSIEVRTDRGIEERQTAISAIPPNGWRRSWWVQLLHSRTSLCRTPGAPPRRRRPNHQLTPQPAPHRRRLSHLQDLSPWRDFPRLLSNWDD
jgi:hypothetical protein